MAVLALRRWSDGTEMFDPVIGLIVPSAVLDPTPGALITITRAGRLRRGYARCAVAPGGGGLTLTLMVNGVILPGFTILIGPAATFGSNLVSVVAVVPGDRVTWTFDAAFATDPQATTVDVELAQP